MTVALVAILVGSLLVYAALKGKSVTALLTGDSTVGKANEPLSTEAT